MTLPVEDPDRAFSVSLTDDERKLVYSRLGDRLRIAGTAELDGYDQGLNLTRCQAILQRTLEIFPGVSDPNRATFLGRAKARNTVKPSLHRPHQTFAALCEHRPRHARMDAQLRLRSRHRRHRLWPKAGGRLQLHAIEETPAIHSISAEKARDGGRGRTVV